MNRNSERLAIFGGAPVLAEPLPLYNSIAQEEINAVLEVLQSGCLSAFHGTYGEQFWGGPQVRAFEEAWCERFGVKHAVSVNSATSGLYAAMGAIGISPGDEVIVPPYTMSATVMAPLIYGGIPVFVDIDPDTFCLDPEAVRCAITPRTKAILAVNLFGHPAPLAALRSIALEHNLFLVEDNAQAPLAAEAGRYCGTVGDIGVFSLNYHKHIHTGEGGMCVTGDENLCRRLQMIRNHAENIVEPLDVQDLRNLIGFNYRMTEMSAAVGVEQLKKIDQHVGRREALAAQLTEGIRDLEGLIPPVVREGCRHVYYVWGIRFQEERVGISRETFSAALRAEGFPHDIGYVRPLYLLPMFQKRVVFGSEGYPLSISSRRYDKGLCPVTEHIEEAELILFQPCMYDVDSTKGALLVTALRKVYEGRKQLAALGVRAVGKEALSSCPASLPALKPAWDLHAFPGK